MIGDDIIFTSIDEILNKAKTIENKCLYDIYDSDEYYRFNNKNSKGRLGQTVEEVVFNYKVNSNKEADFKEYGIELKVAPMKRINQKPNSILLREQEGLSAKERIVISIINYMEICNESWDDNTLLDKCRNLLLMFYIHEDNVDIKNLIFRLVNLWSPSEADLKVIRKDWEIITNKVKNGKAHEISEGDTSYLGACTKGSTAELSLRNQPFSGVKAKQRAFTLKRSYVDYIIEELLRKSRYDTLKQEKSIVTSCANYTFDEIVLKTFKKLINLNLKEIINNYSIKRERKAKNYIRIIIDDICKIEFGDKIENLSEFKKANIEIKTILLQLSGMPKESMSFEQIDYCEIIKETWDESEIKNKFENKKHLWIVFQANKNYKMQKDLDLSEIVLKKVMFWNMPISDLEGSMYNVWKDTVEKIKNNEYYNFIKISDDEISHIRPKAINLKDKMVTPQGTLQTKKCFWLNAKYIKEQVEKEG